MNSLTESIYNLSQFQRNVVDNYEAGRTTLCAADFQLIRDWQLDPNLTVANSNLFTVSGWNIMQGLGQRYRERYPTLLPAQYDRQRFIFRHTRQQRTQGSIRAFAEGLFGSFENVEFEPVPENDTFLRVNFSVVSFK